MDLVTLLRNVVALLVITIGLANGQNFPNMMGNPFMPQSPMGQNMFNQPNNFMPQNMFPAGPQPPDFNSNPFKPNSPGSQGPAQNPFGTPFSSMPMPQDSMFPQPPALSPNPQDFNSGSPSPQYNPVFDPPGPSPQDFNSGFPTRQFNPVANPQRPASSQGPITSPSSPQNFNSGPPIPQFNPVQSPQGPFAPQGPSVNSPGPQDFSSGSPAPQSNPAPNSQGPPASQSTAGNSPGPKDPNANSSGSTSNQQKPEPNSSGGSNTAPVQPRSGKGKSVPHRVRAFRRPSHTRYRSSHVANQPGGDPLRGRRIVCIFNNRHSKDRNFSPANIDPSLCTHINYEFAMLDPKTYEIMSEAPDLDIEENFYQQAVDLKKRNKNLKVILALGGWMDSTKKYSELAADPDKIKNFIEKTISFLKAHEFDGMDFAWEYPNCWQGALGVSPKDKDNFVTILGEMKPQFEQNGLILSISVGAIKREVEAAYDVPAISKLVDFINVMTYDMHGPWEKVTGHHTQFETLPGDEDPYLNVKGGMQVWIDKGAPKNKLNMGLSFYGKSFRLADPDNCGVGAPALGIGNAGPISGEGGFLLYREICQYLNSGNWTQKEEKNVGFYAYEIVGNRDQWVCYDPPMMQVRKAKFVVEGGLGGVLLKDISGDDFEGQCFDMPYPLLKMVRLEMIQRVRKLYG